MKTKMIKFTDQYLYHMCGIDTTKMNLHEKISARREAEFSAGDKKFSTKNEMGELSTELRRVYADLDRSKNETRIPHYNLGADGMAMLYDCY